jgi:uronate dehydrogenase
VHLRILSCAQVTSAARAWNLAQLPDDLIQLVTRAIDTPSTGYSVVYGVSGNDRSPVDNRKAGFLGYRPRDNAEQFAQAILSDTPPPDPSDPAERYHGGPFASVDLGHSGMATMTIVDDRKKT